MGIVTKAVTRLAPALAVVALIAPAHASAEIPLLADCADGIVDGDYAIGELRRALRDIPADGGEYGLCSEALPVAIAELEGNEPKAKPSQRNGSDLDGDGTVTPAEAREAKHRRHARRAEAGKRAKIAGDLSSAGPALEIDEASDGLSWPLLLGLIALVCALIGGGLWYAARRNPAARS
jgi:hypothetical protein